MVRFKNRYIVVQIDPVDADADEDFNVMMLKSGSLYTSIINMVQQMHGDFGVAAVRPGLTAKYCNESTRVAVIRVRHGPHRLVASCLPMVTEVDKRKVKIRILYTGATLQQCYRFIKHYQFKELEKLWTTFKGEAEIVIERALKNFRTLENLPALTPVG